MISDTSVTLTDSFTVSPPVTVLWPSGSSSCIVDVSNTGASLSPISAAYSAGSASPAGSPAYRSSSIRSSVYRSSSFRSSVFRSSSIGSSVFRSSSTEPTANRSSSITKNCPSVSCAFSSTLLFPRTMQPASNNANILFLFMCISFGIRQFNLHILPYPGCLYLYTD